jgi:hypothetical protein
MCGFAQILEVGLKPDPIDKALNKRDNFVKHKHRIPCTWVCGVWVWEIGLVWWGWGLKYLTFKMRDEYEAKANIITMVVYGVVVAISRTAMQRKIVPRPAA